MSCCYYLCHPENEYGCCHPESPFARLQSVILALIAALTFPVWFPPYALYIIFIACWKCSSKTYRGNLRFTELQEQQIEAAIVEAVEPEEKVELVNHETHMQ